ICVKKKPRQSSGLLKVLGQLSHGGTGAWNHGFLCLLDDFLGFSANLKSGAAFIILAIDHKDKRAVIDVNAKLRVLVFVVALRTVVGHLHDGVGHTPPLETVSSVLVSQSWHGAGI